MACSYRLRVGWPDEDCLGQAGIPCLCAGEAPFVPRSPAARRPSRGPNGGRDGMPDVHETDHGAVGMHRPYETWHGGQPGAI